MTPSRRKFPRICVALLICVAVPVLSVLFFLYAWPSLCANPFEAIEIEEVRQPNGEKVRLSAAELEQLQRYLRTSRPFSSIGVSIEEGSS